MSQREALLEGAKKCLAEKGYSRTTARDIAAASGAHLASIGYHFGSKDRLMNTAVLEMAGEWGTRLGDAARAAGGDDPAQRLAAVVSELVAAIPSSRDLHAASLAAFAQAPFDEALRQELAAGFSETRRSLAAIVLGTDEVAEGSESERGLGALVYAVVTGLVAQAVIDPDSFPDPEVAAGAVRAISEG